MRSSPVAMFFRVLVAILLLIILSAETFALTLMIRQNTDYNTSFKYLADMASYYYKTVFQRADNPPEAQANVQTE